MNKLVERLRETAAKATKGPWYTDTIKSEGGRGKYDAYALYSESAENFGNPASICDTTNSSIQEEHVEYDEDGASVWDEVGRRNMDYIVAAQPQNIIALLDALTASRAEVESLRTAGKCALNVCEQLVEPQKFGSSPQIVWAQALEAASLLRASLNGGKP